MHFKVGLRRADFSLLILEQTNKRPQCAFKFHLLEMRCYATMSLTHLGTQCQRWQCHLEMEPLDPWAVCGCTQPHVGERQGKVSNPHGSGSWERALLQLSGKLLSAFPISRLILIILSTYMMPSVLKVLHIHILFLSSLQQPCKAGDYDYPCIVDVVCVWGGGWVGAAEDEG